MRLSVGQTLYSVESGAEYVVVSVTNQPVNRVYANIECKRSKVRSNWSYARIKKHLTGWEHDKSN